MNSGYSSNGTRGPTSAELPRLAFTAMEAPAVLGVSDDFFRAHIAPELKWVRRGSKKLVRYTSRKRSVMPTAASRPSARNPAA